MELSEQIIEKKANELRAKLGFDTILAPCMCTVLDQFQAMSSHFQFRIAHTAEVGAFEAMMDDETHTLVMREWVFEQLKSGRTRERFTVAHELGHYLLGHKGLRQRTQSQAAYPTAKARIEEREADLFASFFLVPTKLGWDASNPEEIAERFQVSTVVAQIAFERIAKAKRLAAGQKRRPPDSVIDFLKEAERRGHKIRSDLSDFD